MAFRKKLYHQLEDLQSDLDAWQTEYESEPAAFRQVLLWENADADLSGFQASGGRKAAGSFPGCDFVGRKVTARRACGCGLAFCQIKSELFTPARF